MVQNAEEEALRLLEQGHNFPLLPERLFILDEGIDTGMLKSALEALEEAEYHDENPAEWARGVLLLEEKEAMPIIKVFLRTFQPDRRWTIPERIYSSDLLPYYDHLVKTAVVSLARHDVYDKWDAAHP